MPTLKELLVAEATEYEFKSALDLKQTDPRVGSKP
jgi:hypothetical protein